ncbi:putative Glycine--tRNA ligase 1 [Paratrimastix pyriformis]|uniref:Glycine--tRNA ligase 1 n=1 Tax=Paratrimastix pyriformis TaxID=342808 RepID=A0ABQ8UJW9_9EUKA|nr:putative Glycine--tRNA ligase 1 [Paratrimastix pyriformis]
MFPTQIGAAGNCPSFLRPELAQGMFVNFKRLYESVGRLPFACGQVYRNEIAPRGGMFLREFTLAEIEHFCRDDEKRHPKFAPLAGLSLQVWSREAQEKGEHPVRLTLGEALATVPSFLEPPCGIRADCIRFRQHLLKQMAHYARDCYDAEVRTQAGWIEVVGLADRSCFDLTQHSKATGVDLVAHERLDPPVVKDELKIVPNKKEMGKTLKGAAQPVCAHLDAMTEEQVGIPHHPPPQPQPVRAFQAQLARDGHVTLTVLVPVPVEKKKDAAAPAAAPLPPVPTTVELLPNMVEFKTVQTKISDRVFIPAVIEPSFGISRIFNTILEHCFYRRPEDVKRGVFRFPPMLAPTKCAIFPLSGDDRFQPVCQKIASDLVKLGLSRTIDASGVAIGRRYARADEVGTPYAVTVDFDTIDAQHPNFESVTLRERDSCEQIRVKIAELPALVRGLVEGTNTWADAKTRFPTAARPASDE